MAVSITIDITVNSQSIANNTSNVTVKVNAKWTGGSYNLLEKSGSVTIDGTKYTFTSPFNTGRTTSGVGNLYTKTLNISHNSDGTKTLACSASYTSGVSSGTVGASCSKVLTTIPRKSTLSVANGTLGTAQTLTVTRQSTSFTHTITYACGSASGTICTKSTNTSISFTPPLSLASQNTTGTSVSVKYTITTYNGNTSLGSNNYTKTCTIPASVKPSCTISISDPTGYYLSSPWDAYIQGLSKFAVTVTPTTSYGSAIASYSVTANGSTYTKASFTTDVIKSSGSLSITATVKDKRGRVGTATLSNIKVLEYKKPAVTKFVAQRCDADGTVNSKGSHIKVTFSSTVSPLNNSSGMGFNDARYTIGHRLTSDSAYIEENLSDIRLQYDITDYEHIFEADPSSSYDVRLIVSDIANDTTVIKTVSSGYKFMSFRSGGSGIAFGKTAELENTAEFDFDVKCNRPVYGKVLGMDRLPAIPANSDFNTYMDPGCYAVHSNAIAATCANMPVDRAGRLEVWSSTGEGVRSEQWSYLRQRFIPYNSSNAVWEREITRSSDNVWNYYNWWKSSLTPNAATKVYHDQKMLWGGDLTSGMYMTEGHTITLTEPVSAQPYGIILVFSAYESAEDTNYGWQSFFVPKILVATSTSGHTFELSRGKHTRKGTKYLYIYDDHITGHADNNLTGTSNGITYANNKFVLRYVIGI